jgi:hypothetical protein
MESLSTEHLKKLNLKRLYKGTYLYMHNGSNYCEENFEVLKSKEKSSLQFNSEMLSRTKKGELFQANVSYVVSSNFIPTIVQIQKQLGKESCQEVYRYNENSSTIEYKFFNRGVVDRREIKVTSKFHIAAPTAAQSMLFILTKNFDLMNKQSCKIIRNDNKWIFKDGPYDENIIADKATAGLRSLNIGHHKLKASPYYLYEETAHQANNMNNLNVNKPESHLTVHISKYHAIPYLIEDKINDHRIEISKLKNLVADEN